MSPRSTRAALVATFVVFVFNGFVFATWAARIPAAAEILQLSSGQIGGLLLFGAVGSLLALPLSGAVVGRLGSANSVRLGAGVAAAGAAALGGALTVASVPLTGVALFVLGIGIAVWDVSMNIQGTDVERALRATVLPKFHAGFSGGAFIGALVGAGMAGAGVDLPAHLWGIVVLAVIAMAVIPRWFLPDAVHEPDGGPPPGRLDAWREPRTLVLGLIVLGAALTEGAANDWIAKAAVDGLGVDEAAGALTFAAFVLSMTVFRYAGSALVDRFGRVAVLYASFGTGLVGVLLFVLAPGVLPALIGAVLWGAGAAMGFPLGISAAADEPRRAAARVSVVTTIGYSAFLAGPPVLGFLGDHVGIRTALLAVGVVALASTVAVRAARPPATASSRPGGTPQVESTDRTR